MCYLWKLYVFSRVLKVFIHIIFWSLFTTFILYSQRVFYPDISIWIYIGVQLFLVIATVFIFYLNYAVFVPHYILNNKRWGRYLLAALGLILFSGFCSFIISAILPNTPNEIKKNGSFEIFISGGITGTFFLLISTGSRLISQYFSERQRRIELKNIAKQAELEAYKAKMNPHFLYNAFNTLYALAKTRSNLTAPAILQLSKMMRYVAYYSDVSSVPLNKEVELVRSYIAFQKLRITNPEDKIVIRIMEPVADFVISPLVLLPFIENAFKHSNLLNPESSIQVNFEVKENTVYYTVSNTIAENYSAEHGIGLKTLKRILELAYEGQHELNIWKDQSVHYAELIFELNDKKYSN